MKDSPNPRVMDEMIDMDDEKMVIEDYIKLKILIGIWKELRKMHDRSE